MKTVYSEKHLQHSPAKAISENGFGEYFEKPERALYVLDAIKKNAIGEIVPPAVFGLDTIRKVHSPRYIDFLQNAYERLSAIAGEGPFYPACSALQNSQAPEPRSVYGQYGLYLADGSAPISRETWDVVLHSAYTAQTAQMLISNGERAAFALCRPPGHHAAKAHGGGFCYINNAAVAAQGFLDQGMKRVAILDVDYHHGNGTQDIFYDRDDVLFLSIHAHPADDYPFYLGYDHEKGTGKGEGYNRNYPLPLGTTYTQWLEALTDSFRIIRDNQVEALIISLGVDTFKHDPISKFQFESEDYTDMGRRIAGLELPTLFVMEGGYAIDEVGTNVANVLKGFLDR